MKRTKCECGHFKTSHYDSLMSARVGCHAVNTATGKPLGCKCLKTQQEVARDAEISAVRKS